MSKKTTLKVTLSDGSVETRKTTHAYTHAVVCMYTLENGTKVEGVWRWTSSQELGEKFIRSTMCQHRIGGDNITGFRIATVEPA